MIRQKTRKIICLTCNILSVIEVSEQQYLTTYHAFHFSNEVITLKWSDRKKKHFCEFGDQNSKDDSIFTPRSKN